MKRITALALSLVLAAALALPAAAQESSPFGDVPDGHWAAAAIARASRDGVMVGTGTIPETGLARFSPDGTLTAAQFATILVRGFYPDQIDEGAEGAWYMPFVNAASDAGLFTGVQLESWDEPMTRYNMARMLYNVLWDKAVPLPDQKELAETRAKIGDWAQVPEEYQTAVAASYALGMLSGTDGAGTFAGTQVLRRAQAAAVYGRLADAVNAESQDPDTDRMQIELDRLIAGVESLIPAGSGSYELYPWEGGTVFVSSQAGAPHGGRIEMLHVDKKGGTLSISDLLPGYPVNYISPRDISVKDGILTFITPVKEVVDFAAGTAKGWGDTLCTVDLTAGTMVSMIPAEQAKLWRVTVEADPSNLSNGSLMVTLLKKSGQAQPEVQECSMPHNGMQVDMSDYSIMVCYPAGLTTDPAFLASKHGEMFKALETLGLPDNLKMNSSFINTPAQQEQVGKYFQVTLNGQPISGHLSWMFLADGEVDLWFTTNDEPMWPKDGDVLSVRMGMPQT